MSQIEELVAHAERLVNEGRWQEAEEVWRDLHRRDPGHPKALFGLGIHALQRGDTDQAIGFLTKACETSPNDVLALLTLARAHGDAGDPPQVLQAIERALAVDAYSVPALLAKARFMEQYGSRSSAAFLYKSVLKIVPMEARWPDSLRPSLEHARKVVATHSKDLADHIDRRLKGRFEGLHSDQAVEQRWREAASIIAGRSEPYVSHCNQLYVPRLPAIPFFDVSMFEWAATIEAKTDVIRAELLTLLAEDSGGFAPYIEYPPGSPVNQWRELNHSTRWSTYKIWTGGVADERGQGRCPETTRALAQIGMADIEGLCPNAMFSALAPRTHIPPHTGETNARLVVHLPLIVPEKCSYRVGHEWRRWEVGKLLIFDDTLEHEARNESDELRVVLIFDVWNPLLSAAEREMVRAMTSAVKEFSAQ